MIRESVSSCVDLSMSRSLICVRPSSDVKRYADPSQVTMIFLPANPLGYAFWLQSRVSRSINCFLFASLLNNYFQSVCFFVFSPFKSPVPRLSHSITFTEFGMYISVLSTMSRDFGMISTTLFHISLKLPGISFR